MSEKSNTKAKNEDFSSLFEESKALFPKVYADPKLSQHIIKASSQYLFNENRSLWEESWFEKAYLSYFIFTQSARISYVLDKVSLYLAEQKFNTIFDFGCGPGTVQKIYESKNFISPPKDSWVNIDSSQKALENCKKWNKKTKFKTVHTLSKTLPEPKTANDLFIGSYVLCEGVNKEALNKFNTLLILEPGQKAESKNLIEFRNQAVEKEGFTVLSPCTHQMACPLTFEKKHWCHDTVTKPSFLNSYNLPFSDTKLNFSYVFMTRDQGLASRLKSNTARVIGDLRKEKGKTKVAVCKSDQLNYLSWLKKTKLKVDLNRGDLIRWDNKLEEKKGNEFRISQSPFKMDEKIDENIKGIDNSSSADS